MGLVGAAWGIAGFLILLAYAILKLSGPATATFSQTLLWYHWLALTCSAGFFLYVKGYRAFQRGLSRSVVARALGIRTEPGVLKVVLAPLYCMGFFGAGRRRQMSMICITLVMVAFIMVLTRIGQPWRGIVDFGLVASFAWGSITTLLYALVPQWQRRASGPTH